MVYAEGEKDPTRLNIPLPRGSVETRLTEAVQGVDLGAMLEQYLHYVVVTLVHRQVQGRQQILE